MRFINFLTIIVVLSFFISCQSSEQKTENTETEQSFQGHKVKVEEVKQGNTYTYLKVTENNEEYWIATAKGDFSEGAMLYYGQGLEMKDFKSNEVDQTFDRIFFVQSLSTEPMMAGNEQLPEDPHNMRNRTAKVASISVEKSPGGITIAELYGAKDDYSGKKVVIRGQVTKFNSGIMGSNWAHIQDGSGEEKYDLTVTTSETVKVGEVVTFEGTVSLNKDFGAGYKYEVLIEQAKLVSKS